MMLIIINPQLREYVEEHIIPLYDSFDAGHRRDHADTVVSQALEFCKYYDVNPDMVYAAAAFHDTGLREGRERHHLVSGEIIRSDKALPRWFSPEQIETIAQAAEDHRASLGHEPRSIYGRIVAEADRLIIPEVVIRRAIQYSLANYPDYDEASHLKRCVDHLREKYGDGGYLRLWIPESPNAARMEALRAIIRDESALGEIFRKEYALLKR